MTEPLRLVVLGDSTAFTDHTGPKLPDDKTLYPNVLAGSLEAMIDRPVALSVLARAGMDVREAWRVVAKDRHAMFEVLMGADAVVVAVGSIDHAPSGVPAPVEALVPFLRPAALRHRTRRGLLRVHPAVVRATGARLSHTPIREFERLYDKVLLQVRGLAYGAAAVALGPTSHRSVYYGLRHPQHARREATQARIAADHGLPFVRCWPLVEPFAGALNPDGIHWPPEAHAAVGERLATALADQILGRAPRPTPPGA